VPTGGLQTVLRLYLPTDIITVVLFMTDS
jgi:hypothetical protein